MTNWRHNCDSEVVKDYVNGIIDSSIVTSRRQVKLATPSERFLGLGLAIILIQLSFSQTKIITITEITDTNIRFRIIGNTGGSSLPELTSSTPEYHTMNNSRASRSIIAMLRIKIDANTISIMVGTCSNDISEHGSQCSRKNGSREILIQKPQYY